MTAAPHRLAAEIGMDCGVYLTRLKRLGRQRSFVVLDEYLRTGSAFEGHPLSGVL